MKSVIAAVLLSVAIAACAQQPMTQSDSTPAVSPGAQLTPHQAMTGCMQGMSGGHGAMMGGHDGMKGCPMMSQAKDAKGMSCCCGNMGKEQPKDPA